MAVVETVDRPGGVDEVLSRTCNEKEGRGGPEDERWGAGTPCES